MARGAGSSRGFGSGGNRGFGGRSGGGSFNRGSVNRGGISGGSFGRTPSQPRTSSGSNSGGIGGGGSLYNLGLGYLLGRNSRGGSGGGNRNFNNNSPGNNQDNGNTGCLLRIIFLILFLLLIAYLFTPNNNLSSGYGMPSGEVTKSTVARQPLPKGSVTETGYYTDQLGWINNSTTLTTGMRNFYQQTGVQPYLYLTDTINNSHFPTDQEVEVFAGSLYDQLFQDEAHLLVIFFEYQGNYKTWYLTGTQAKSVLDDEAMDILLDYLDRYYAYQNLSDEQVFSNAFNDAGVRIMQVTTSPWIPVFGGLAFLGALLLAFLWWRNYQRQKNLEAEQTKEILSKPLESFGTTKADDLASKYEDENNDSK